MFLLTHPHTWRTYYFLQWRLRIHEKGSNVFIHTWIANVHKQPQVAKAIQCTPVTKATVFLEF